MKIDERGSLGYLESAAALESLRRDPYWPKWDSPWWHMTLLWELGRADEIPGAAVEHLIASMEKHLLKAFPVSGGLPEGKDPHRNVACHCALGTIYQVLTACGIDVDARLPWIRPWFLRYQLSDGGLNCDESAYAKPNGKSSIVSTLPPLEAVLRCTRRPLTREEADFLDRGAEYLMAHRLFRATSGKVIDGAWLDPVFPRFYHYDALRGLAFLVDWSAARGKGLPRGSVEEAHRALRQRFESPFTLTRTIWESETTLDFVGGFWIRRLPSSRFALLEESGSIGRPAPRLVEDWNRIEGASVR